MKTIKNSYHKKLIFPLVGTAIGANEIKTVTDEQAAQMINSKWITMHSSVTENIAHDALKDKYKGRK